MSISDISFEEIEQIRQTCRTLVGKCQMAIVRGAPHPHVVTELQMLLDEAAGGPEPERTVVSLRRAYSMFIEAYDEETREADFQALVDGFESVEDYLE